MLMKAAIVASLLLIASCATPPRSPNVQREWVDYYQVETTKPYDEVLAELEIAIGEHNFRITAVGSAR